MPERDQIFEHFYFAIQAALDGLGVMMGPIALVGQELHSDRLAMPWPQPALRSRGCLMHTPEVRRNALAVAALRRWLLHAGQATEVEYPAYLPARKSNRTTSARATP
jgi:LysR family transcriptional regulator, glycine cleavage system transcriptional activator